MMEEEIDLGTRLLSPEEKEDEIMVFIEEQFGLNGESDDEQKKEHTKLEK